MNVKCEMWVLKAAFGKPLGGAGCNDEELPPLRARFDHTDSTLLVQSFSHMRFVNRGSYEPIITYIGPRYQTVFVFQLRLIIMFSMETAMFSWVHPWYTRP